MFVSLRASSRCRKAIWSPGKTTEAHPGTVRARHPDDVSSPIPEHVSEAARCTYVHPSASLSQEGVLGFVRLHAAL
jgi:hypothetical protein